MTTLREAPASREPRCGFESEGPTRHLDPCPAVRAVTDRVSGSWSFQESGNEAGASLPGIAETGWIAALIDWEEQERARRSLERRLGNAHLGRFRPLADFNWDWPDRCDREAIEELMGLEFLHEAANAILIGPNGVGKSTIARNIAHLAVLAGHTVLCTSAGQMLNDLAGAADGCTLLGLAALDQRAEPDFDRDTARRLVTAGMPIAAMTPERLADWVGRQIHRSG